MKTVKLYPGVDLFLTPFTRELINALFLYEGNVALQQGSGNKGNCYSEGTLGNMNFPVTKMNLGESGSRLAWFLLVLEDHKPTKGDRSQTFAS